MPNLIPTTFRRDLPLGLSLSLAAGCLAALALPTSAPAAVDEAAAIRARGPRALDALLARYDELPAGAERDRLAREIDSVAGQRYATESRLYWYTDLERAKEAARAQRQPILALRMLGRLDEDLSCANSRLFRATLYANTEVASFLRANFVLYWSSERPVPRVTIDFGDGRKLERTTTGNSAHYVLDEHGAVLDVLPGLYAPVAFRAELAKSLQLAATVRRLDGEARVAVVIKFHEAGRADAARGFAAVAGTEYIRRDARLLDAGDIGLSAVQRAQQATMTKAAIEVVELARLGIDAGAIDPADVAQWATIGQRAWNIGLVPPASGTMMQRVRRGMFVPKAPVFLDARSRALVQRLHGVPTRANAATGAATGSATAESPEIGMMLARLEQTIVADTALNQFRLRQQIRDHIIARRDLAFETLNEWVYATVFHTPRTDAWLGLLSRTDFTGLPGDGVVMP